LPNDLFRKTPIMSDAHSHAAVSAPAAAAHAWKFFRIGGFDQVSIESWEDLAHLGELDQKLWGALSVPARGLAIEERSLALIDADGDGHIRPPELLAALTWAGERLTPAGRAALVDGRDVLPLAWIDAERHPALLSALRHILAGLAKPEAGEIAVADTCEAVDRFAAQPLNGDGIVQSGKQRRCRTRRPDRRSGGSPMPGRPTVTAQAGVDAGIFGRFQADLAALAWPGAPCRSRMPPASRSARRAKRRSPLWRRYATRLTIISRAAGWRPSTRAPANA
jgi:hypothetical protein